MKISSPDQRDSSIYDFKGLGFSKVGHFKEVREKIKELEDLNIELAERHNRLQAIINSISDGLSILDRNLNVLYVNKVQAAMFPGISLIGKKCHDVLYRRDETCRNCHALRTLETNQTYRGEILISKGGLAGRYFEWTVSPVNDPFGQVSQIILLMRDITQRKEYELKLMQADRMAAIGLLAGSIAHEINNPLTSIAGFSEGLLKRLKKLHGADQDKILEAFGEYLQIIFDEAYRCKDIIQNLLDYSRNSSDADEPLDVYRIIGETIALLRQHAKDHKIKISVENKLASGTRRVYGNESQLKHLILNLFNLAFQAVGSGGEITTVLRNNQEHIKVLMMVLGSDKSSRRWDDLLSSSCLNERPASSYPISMSVCYNIMRNHDGELVFETSEHGTATFTLTFPARMPSDERDSRRLPSNH